MSPDRRRHRGPHPEDPDLFSESRIPALRTAVAELSWLLSRGYAARSSLKLVGDRHDLRERQRTAVARSACTDHDLDRRSAARVHPESLRGEDLLVDGLNVIVSVEAALAGGAVLHCRDEAYRDLASVHGSYRRVEETRRALQLIGEALDRFAPARTRWLLDRPVSNSGRLATEVRTEAERRGIAWTVELVTDPDPIMWSSDRTIATSDSAILDRCTRWVGLTRLVIDDYISDGWILDLRPAPPRVR